jgi:outer membrane protein assembly factor BamB
MKAPSLPTTGFASKRMLYSAMTLIASGLSVASHAGIPADWPAFQGPNSNGAGAATISELSDGRIAWRVDLPGSGLSSPVITDRKIFLTCSSGSEQDRLHVVCLDAGTGDRIWHRQLWATGRTMCHKKTNVAAPTPCTDGTQIYALFSSNDLVCFDLTGRLVWLRGITADYPNVSNSLGMSSSLVVTNGVVVAQVENDSESYAIGIDTTTGQNRWRLDRPKAANWTSPTLLAAGLVGLQSKNGVDAIEVGDGGVAWQYTGGASTIPSSCRHRDILFVPSQGLVALSCSNLIDKAPQQLWKSSRLSPGTPSPVASDETVFTISRGDVLTAGNTADGERRWQLRLKGPFSSTPVVLGNKLLTVNEEGVVQLIAFSDDQAEVTGTLSLDTTVLASPAVTSTGVFIRGESSLWKLRVDTE